MRSKELREKRAQLVKDARAQVAGDAPTDEQNARFDAMMLEADRVREQIDRIERADEIDAANMERLRSAGQRTGRSADQVHEDEKLEVAAFDTFIRRGRNALDAEQRAIYERRFQAAQGEGSDVAGGYTVPQGFYQRLVDAQLQFGGMLGVSYVFDTATGNGLPIPTDNDTSNKGTILGENAQVSPQDVTFGSVTLNAYTFSSKLVLVSNQLLQDSAFDLNAFLNEKLALRIARIINDYFTTGSGSNQPNGAVNAAPLGATAGGSTTSGAMTTITYNDLVELEHSVDPAYRLNGRFMMSDAALKILKKLNDGIGRPLWLSGIAVKEPDTINGYPYVINQSMAAPAQDAKSVLFGDFQNYFVRRVVGVQVLRLTERYADNNQTGFLAFQRWDGNMVDAGTHPVKYLQQSHT